MRLGLLGCFWRLDVVVGLIEYIYIFFTFFAVSYLQGGDCWSLHSIYHTTCSVYIILLALRR